MVVLKKDCKSMRICGDFSVTVNPVSKLDRYPIPKVEDLFARLGFLEAGFESGISAAHTG